VLDQAQVAAVTRRTLTHWVGRGLAGRGWRLSVLTVRTILAAGSRLTLAGGR